MQAAETRSAAMTIPEMAALLRRRYRDNCVIDCERGHPWGRGAWVRVPAQRSAEIAYQRWLYVTGGPDTARYAMAVRQMLVEDDWWALEVTTVDRADGWRIEWRGGKPVHSPVMSHWGRPDDDLWGMVLLLASEPGGNES